jgi:hypothetical protein
MRTISEQLFKRLTGAALGCLLAMPAANGAQPTATVPDRSQICRNKPPLPKSATWSRNENTVWNNLCSSKFSVLGITPTPDQKTDWDAVPWTDRTISSAFIAAVTSDPRFVELLPPNSVLKLERAYLQGGFSLTHPIIRGIDFRKCTIIGPSYFIGGDLDSLLISDSTIGDLQIKNVKLGELRLEVYAGGTVQISAAELASADVQGEFGRLIMENTKVRGTLSVTLSGMSPDTSLSGASVEGNMIIQGALNTIGVTISKVLGDLYIVPIRGWLSGLGMERTILTIQRSFVNTWFDLNPLVLLSQKVAAFADENHVFGKI